MRRLTIGGVILLGLLALTLLVLLGGNAGLDLGLWAARQSLGPALSLSGARGSLLGPLHIERLEWHDDRLRVVASGIDLDWSAAALQQKQLVVHRLDITELEVWQSPSETQPPTSLCLPLGLRLAAASIVRLRLHYGNAGLLEAQAIDLSGSSDGCAHRLDALAFSLGGTRVTAQADIAGRPPFAASLSADIAGLPVADRPVAVRLQARGSLRALELSLHSAVGTVPVSGTAQLDVFAAQPLQRAALETRGLDPRLLDARAPEASLDARLRLDPVAAAAGSLRGELQVVNRRPGPLEQDRLPLRRLQARFAWDGQALQLDAARADDGGNSIEAQGRLGRPGDRLLLRAHAPRLEVAGYSAEADAQVQLGGSLAALRLEWSLQAAQLVLPQGQRIAGLSASGRLQRAGEQWTGVLQGLSVAAPEAVALAAPARLLFAPGEARLEHARFAGRPWTAQLELLAWRAGTWQARGSFAALPARLFLPAAAAGSDLSLAGDWDLALGRGLSGQARLRREAGDLVLDEAGQTLALGLDRLELQLDSSEGQQLRLALDAHAAKLGKLSGRLSAELERWQLARGRPWSGRLDIDTPSLAWVSALSQGQIEVAGRLQGALTLAGTPAQPQAGGHLEGHALELRWTAQQLHWFAGELRLDFADRRAHLVRLEFASQPSRPAPDAPPAVAALAGQRGRL